MESSIDNQAAQEMEQESLQMAAMSAALLGIAKAKGWRVGQLASHDANGNTGGVKQRFKHWNRNNLPLRPTLNGHNKINKES